ncbi:MAG: divalent cation tolerance protein CutA, partial [Thermogladius sp.]
MRGGWVVVLTTAATREEAERIARALLEEKLVACVNIVDAV